MSFLKGLSAKKKILHSRDGKLLELERMIGVQVFRLFKMQKSSVEDNFYIY